MRIDGWSGWMGTERASWQEGATRSTKELKPEASDAGDTAQISSEASLARSLMTALSGIPEVREQKVANLRQSISEGTYKVSSEQIADAMCSDLKGVLR